jgi:predicted NAD/FAD-dependent oxidoreductase
LTRHGPFAVVGAGIAGLACARALSEAGAAVTVFEREQFPGGRAATLIDGAGPYDHGAQYFTAADPRFAAELARWQSAGIVQRWEGRIVAFDGGVVEDKSDSAERFVAVPGMRRLGIHLAQGIDVRHASAIASLRRAAGGWRLVGDGTGSEGSGPFETVLVALPSPAAATLLAGLTTQAEAAAAVDWDPCWAVTMALAQRSGAGFDGAFVNDDPILGWVALDSSKPRRGQVDGVAERWVLHARPQWSRRFADLPQDEVTHWLIRSFAARLRRNLIPLQASAVHWSHALPVNPLPQLCLWDAAQRLGMAGDWCGGPRIEGAYRSGLALAGLALR